MVLEQYGISWYFNKNYGHGQFANGDHYVIADEEGKVQIIYVDPASSSLSKRHVNGSQVNPMPVKTGIYDRRI